MTDTRSDLSLIDVLRTRSLANVVQVEIERMIIDGELRPDERINENGLAQRLGVSRGPIREACSALAAIGLINIIPNRGFFVQALSNEQALDLSEARASVFGCMAMMVAEKVTDERVAVLRRLHDKMQEIAQMGDVHIYYPVNLEFHRQIAEMSGNARLNQIYHSFVRELHIQRFRALASPDVLLVSNTEHGEIVDAIAVGDPVRAMISSRSHILGGIERTQKAGQPAGWTSAASEDLPAT